MKLRFRERFFSWFDSYDIYDEAGRTAFTVEGKLAWGHLFKILDPQGRELACVKEKVLSLLPRFEMYLGERYIGCITKELTLFKPKFHIDCNGWQVNGNFWEWDYTVTDGAGRTVATVSKELWNWTDTYVMDIPDPENGLCVVMLVLAIDANKCTRDD